MACLPYEISISGVEVNCACTVRSDAIGQGYQGGPGFKEQKLKHGSVDRIQIRVEYRCRSLAATVLSRLDCEMRKLASGFNEWYGGSVWSSSAKTGYT